VIALIWIRLVWFLRSGFAAAAKTRGIPLWGEPECAQSLTGLIANLFHRVNEGQLNRRIVEELKRGKNTVMGIAYRTR
jgi:hypothetical protein